MRLRTLLLIGALVAAASVAVASCSGSPEVVPLATNAPPVAVPSAALPSVPAGGGAATSAGGAPGAGGQTAPDASSLVTADMAATVIGGSPTQISTVSPAGGTVSMCVYSNSAGDSLTVLIEKIPGSVPASALQAAIQMAGAQGNLQTVSGLGDAAGKVVDDHDATIAFVKGGALVVLVASADSMSGADIESKLEALAQQVIGKL